MNYPPHALLNCVALISLISYGNAAKVSAPTEVLSHFVPALGSVLVPRLSNEARVSRPNRSATQKESVTASRHHEVETRQVSPQEVNAQRAPALGFGAAQGFPYQYERAYQYRYPPYSQEAQLPQNFFNGGLPASRLPIDPRFFQAQQLGPAGQGLVPLRPNKPIDANLIANGDENVKDNGGKSANAIPNLEGVNGDSKSSAQSRPFDGSEFAGAQPGGGGGGFGNGGLDPGNGNLRVNNRFSAIDYERVRQNYYSDPAINQQGNFDFGFNDVPFQGGPPYRSSLNDRYSGLNYGNGGAGLGLGIGQGGLSSEIRSGTDRGLGDPYVGTGFGPYQSLGYNSLAGGVGGIGGGIGGGVGGGGIGAGIDGASRFDGFGGGAGGAFRFGGPQFQGAGFGGFYQGAASGFPEGDSTLRGTAAKASLAAPRRPEEKPRAQPERPVKEAASPARA